MNLWDDPPAWDELLGGGRIAAQRPPGGHQPRHLRGPAPVEDRPRPEGVSWGSAVAWTTLMALALLVASSDLPRF